MATKTVKEITDQALNLLGYTGTDGNEQLTRRIVNKTIPIFNTVYGDLWQIETDEPFCPVSSMQESVTMRERAIDALIYGIAAFLAQGEDDSDNQQIWMMMYNKKRAGLTKVEYIMDTFPHAERKNNAVSDFE